MRVAQRAAFLGAGALWAFLGVLALLTVFGTMVGLAMAWLVAVRRSVTAARAGALLGALMLLPNGLVLEVLGCRRGDCGPGPYLLAWGVPALVVGLNGIAGWGAWRPGASAVAVGAATAAMAPIAVSITTEDPPAAGQEAGAGT